MTFDSIKRSLLPLDANFEFSTENAEIEDEPFIQTKEFPCIDSRFFSW
jgi:hypothetical protein